jgi:hypothetical protein
LSLPAAAFLLGVLLPDIVDKGLVFSDLVRCSRSYGHTILFAAAAGFVSLAVTRKKGVALAVVLGCLLHLAEDMGGTVPVFYPIVWQDFHACDKYVPQAGSYEMIFEIVGFSLIVIWWKWRAKISYIGRRIKAKVRKFVFGRIEIKV